MMATSNAFRLLLTASICCLLTRASGQTPGLIYQQATNGGSAVLDPNGDGYVSSTTGGFTTSDYTQSEISYKPLTVVMAEPTSDVQTGPSCGFTDFADNGQEQPAYAYLSSANNLLFRFRLSGAANNSKGYSILIDTDQKFGASDPNYTTANPGFELEIELATNFGVRLYNVDGVSSPSSYLVQLPYNDYSQKSVAYTTSCSNTDYFYDFYIPFSVITSFLPSITTTTPLRMVASTVISPQSALSGVSDIGGFDDSKSGACHTCAWTTLITNFPATAATSLGSSGSGIATATPVVNSPIVNGSTSVSGTSTAADGTVIKVYVNGSVTPYGTATVSSNAWTVTGTALTTGQTVVATAQTGSQPASANSNTVTVTACSTPPTITSVSSPKNVSGTSTEAAGTTVTIYLNGSASALATTTVTSSGTWSITSWSAGALGSGDYVKASTGSCGTSAAYYYCSTKPGTPTIATSPLTTATTSISGTCTAVSGTTIYLYKNGSATSFANVATATASWTVTGISGLATCDVITAKASTSASCFSDASAGVAVTSTVAAAPAITGSYCSTSISSVSGTSTEASGTSIQVYDNGSAAGSAATVDAYGNWKVTGLTILAGHSITAKAIPPTSSCKQTSNASSSVTVGSASSSTSLVITSSPAIKEGATSISGTYPTNGSLIKVYIDNVLLGSATVASGAWSLTGLSAYDVYTGGSLTATATTGTGCESAASAAVVVLCNAPLATPGVSPSSTTVCSGGTSTVTLSNSESGVTYQLYVGSITSTTGNAVLGTGGTITLTSGALTTTSTLNILASKVSSGTCRTTLTGSTTVTISALPTVGTATVSSTPACNNGTGAVQLTSTTAGNTYQLRRGTTNEGSSQAGNGATLTFTTNAINGATSFSVLVTNNTTGCTTTSNTVTITPSGGPSASQSVTVNNSTVCVNTGTTAINVATQSSYSYSVYDEANALLGTLVGDGTTKSLSVGPWTSVTTKTYHVTTTLTAGGGCTVTLTTQPTVSVTSSPSASNAGSNQSVCISSTTLSATSPTFGTGAWSQVSGPTTATFSSTSSTTPTVSNLSSGSYVFRWTVTATCTGSTPSTSDVTIKINCPAVYSVATAQSMTDYTNGYGLATVTDSDGSITGALLASGSSLPPGTTMDAATGRIAVSNYSTLVAGTYFFNVTTTDAKGEASTSSLVMSFGASDVSLPVTFTTFTAKAVAEGIRLAWQTISEVNNSRFEVQRSQDASHFVTLGKVKGLGNRQQYTTYHFTDEHPLGGWNYYRLVQVDVDEKRIPSETIAIESSSVNQLLHLNLWPNPSAGELRVVVSGSQQERIVLQVRSLSNQLMLEKRWVVEEGKLEHTLDLAWMPDGLYVFIVRGQQEQVVRRLIKLANEQ